MCVCVCVSVCVRERGRERERERECVCVCVRERERGGQKTEWGRMRHTRIASGRRETRGEKRSMRSANIA